jgi:hypothetical protein
MRRGAGVPPAVARAFCPCRFTAKPVLSGVKEWPFHNTRAEPVLSGAKECPLRSGRDARTTEG